MILRSAFCFPSFSKHRPFPVVAFFPFARHFSCPFFGIGTMRGVFDNGHTALVAKVKRRGIQPIRPINMGIIDAPSLFGIEKIALVKLLMIIERYRTEINSRVKVRNNRSYIIFFWIDGLINRIIQSLNLARNDIYNTRYLKWYNRSFYYLMKFLKNLSAISYRFLLL